MTRSGALLRRLVLVALTIAAAIALVACGDDSSSDTTTATTARSNLPSSAARAPAGTGQLDFLGFEGDDLPEIMADFRKANDIELRSSYVGSESELAAKVLAGGAAGVDLVSFTSPTTRALIEAGAVTPLDPEKIPNLRYIQPFLAEGTEGFVLDDEGRWVGIPMYFGRIGIAWDASAKREVTSWDDIQDPAFAGKIGVIDFPQVLAYQGAAALGLKLDQMSEADLASLRDWLEPIATNAKTFTTSFGDLISLLGSKEVAAVVPGFTFLAGAAQEAGNKDARTTPSLDEATPTIVEMYGIPRTADNPDAAYAWINEMLAPRTNAQVAMLQGSAPTATNALRYVRGPTLELPAYTEGAEAFFKGGYLVSDPPARSDEFVTLRQLIDMWTELKDASGS